MLKCRMQNGSTEQLINNTISIIRYFFLTDAPVLASSFIDIDVFDKHAYVKGSKCCVNPDTFFKSKNAKNPNKDIFFPKI